MNEELINRLEKLYGEPESVRSIQHFTSLLSFIDTALGDVYSKEGEEKTKALIGYMIKMRDYLTVTLHESGLKTILLAKTIETINELHESSEEQDEDNKKKELDSHSQNGQEESISETDQSTSQKREES